MPEFRFTLDLHDVPAVMESRRKQSTMEVLIRHLLARLCQNEMVSIDGDMARALQTAWAAVVPQVFAVLLLFPAYHRPAGAGPREYWSQASDHYFFVMYAVFVMGAVALYSWDVLFPDAVDVFVLGALPIAHGKLLLARVCAVGIFLVGTLLSTSLLGALFLPLMTEQPGAQWHFLGHLTAIVLGGGFAAGSVLALQGILLVVFSERVFQRITPVLQTLGMLSLFTMLFAFPHMAGNLQEIVEKPWVRAVPPLWYLGVYERVMHGGDALPAFHALAARGVLATAVVVALTCITYPIAYRRKVRLVMEGTVQQSQSRRVIAPVFDWIARWLCGDQRQRGIFCFISQTLWRSRRPRTLMAIFLSIGVSLAMVRLAPVDLGNIRIALTTVAFFTLYGLRAAFASPVDLRGVWIFRAVLGRESGEVLDVQKRWVFAAVVGVCGVLTYALTVVHRMTAREGVSTLLVIACFALVTTGLYDRSTTAIPFTEARKATQAERPMAAARYLILFPVLLTWMPLWMSMTWRKLIVFAALTAGVHLLLRRITRHVRANHFDGNLDLSDPDAFPTSLGLRE